MARSYVAGAEAWQWEKDFTLSSLNLPLSSFSTISRELLSQFRLVVDEDDLMWVKIKENCHVLVNQFRGDDRSKSLSCRKTQYIFRDVKLCFNASWGLKGLKGKVLCWEAKFTSGISYLLFFTSGFLDGSEGRLVIPLSINDAYEQMKNHTFVLESSMWKIFRRVRYSQCEGLSTEKEF